MNAATESRLNALKELGEGWAQTGADLVEPKAIEMARKLLEVLSTEPLIYPTVDGGVEMSWNDEAVVVTIYADCCDLYVEGVDE